MMEENNSAVGSATQAATNSDSNSINERFNEIYAMLKEITTTKSEPENSKKDEYLYKQEQERRAKEEAIQKDVVELAGIQNELSQYRSQYGANPLFKQTIAQAKAAMSNPAAAKYAINRVREEILAYETEELAKKGIKVPDYVPKNVKAVQAWRNDLARRNRGNTKINSVKGVFTDSKISSLDPEEIRKLMFTNPRLAREKGLNFRK